MIDLFKKLLVSKEQKKKKKKTPIKPLVDTLNTNQTRLPLDLFPDNVLIHLIQMVIANQSIETASHLISAFPKHLAHFVLIVSDSTTDHYFLTPHMPQSVDTVHLLEFCDKPWQDRRLIPIRILSFSEPETYAISYYLNNLTSCPYARFMSPLTPVIVETFSTTGMPYQLLRKHAQTQGVQVFETTIGPLYKYVELDGLYDKPPTADISHFIPHHPMDQPTLYRKRDKSGVYRFSPKKDVSFLDIVNYHEFNGEFDFPQLRVLRSRFDSRCHDNDCSPHRLTISSGVIQSVHISFSNVLGVAIDDSKVPDKSFEGTDPRVMFMFINENWSFTNPYGRKLCDHHADTGIVDQASMISIKSSNLLRFTKRFTDFYFVGVPDMTLLNCCKEWALTMKWKRLTPLENSEPVMDTQHTIICPSCTTLTIFNKIHPSDIDQNPMSVFDVPAIQSLSLFALEGSEEPWSLDIALKAPAVFKYLKIIHISSLEMSSESRAPFVVHGQALALDCDYLEELHIMGYTPGFCLHPLPSPPFLNDVCFHRLDFIRLDVSSIPRINDNIDLSFPEARFPSLLTVCFDLYDNKNVSGRCPPTTSVIIHSLPNIFRQVNISTIIRSQFVICGKTLKPFDGEVKLGNFAVWELKNDDWEVTDILNEKSYKQWVYEQ